ncbi:patatin-like phospholipase family protein [Streptomyces sp. IBSNAI002]|uniref:patatin-like phospholipase family protein n=1 Tax=Streptomyces sp. IBSNAI002 TaxID=3457500 RepID=UPI003FCF0456
METTPAAQPPFPVPARCSPPDLLVLGAGGPVGLAWQLGWLAETAHLLGNGVPVIGTSAGAMAGALLLLGPERRQAITAALRTAAQQATAPAPADTTPARTATPPDTELRQAAAATYAGGPKAIRALGKLMAARPDDGSHLEQVRQMVGEEWPAGDLTVVAREVSTGERKIFRGTVPLFLAVAGSSAAAGRTGPVSVSGQEYIDGGYGSLLNSDLARGARTVWLLAPAGLGSFTPETVPALMRQELAELRATGTHVEAFTPHGDFTDLGAFTEAGRALDDGGEVARTWLNRP